MYSMYTKIEFCKCASKASATYVEYNRSL